MLSSLSLEDSQVDEEWLEANISLENFENGNLNRILHNVGNLELTFKNSLTMILIFKFEFVLI